MARLSAATAAGLGVAYGAVLAVLLAAHVPLIEQSYNQRILIVVVITAVGAAVAGGLSLWIGDRIAARWPWPLRFAAMALGLPLATLAITGGLYSVLLRDILDSSEADDISYAYLLLSLVLEHGSAAYLMLVGGWTLLFPWPLPAASTVTALLFARRGGEAERRGA